MKLYGFFRSGTSHRTRIVLNLKKINYELQAISLMKNEHKQDSFKALNPQTFVPVLEVNDQLLIQSPAIIEWLEETYPEVALLPQDPMQRAKVRAIAALVGCDIHPINNKRILEYLRGPLGLDDAQVQTWCQHWIDEGFRALEQLLAADSQREGFCVGNQPTLADAYLIPQVDSSKRFQVDLNQYPRIQQIYQNCMALPAFQAAAPQNQPDAV
ncbi:maleylacetoacetate isomerase [Acinetobacter indicus]|uniref:maleylacetoacetate isomerase n=1 Tax=Acinetobacter indicus TaxID=756892 RepID=UPI001364295A|nr:maleylacetoacetate isomerase [Acinetobacter indicus]MDM1285742.1 maleylacetoacetate isomerase [Acinetobacter indicus]